MNNRNTKVVFSLFLINPFLSFLTSIGSLRHQIGKMERNLIFIIISLFFALIAFTQKTSTGDLSRVYDSIIWNNSIFLSSPLECILETKHILFDGMNQLVYTIMGDVRYVSLFWIFIVFYTTLKAVENLIIFKGLEPNKFCYSGIVLSVILCFFIFTQITELMKQSTATALTFWAFGNFLNRNWKKAIIIYFLALNIHFSCLYYFPLVFVFNLKNWIVPVIAVVSFIFRQFNLMDSVVNILSNFPGIGDVVILGQIYSAAEIYRGEHETFFQSGAFMFTLIFYHFFFLSFFSKIVVPKSNLVNVCLLMVVILNLSYTNNHNYTRLLTMMFPFYIMLFLELSAHQSVFRKVLLYALVTITFIINFRFFFLRLFEASYTTSFEDNSILKLVLYPSFAYLFP